MQGEEKASVIDKLEDRKVIAANAQLVSRIFFFEKRRRDDDDNNDIAVRFLSFSFDIGTTCTGFLLKARI